MKNIKQRIIELPVIGPMTMFGFRSLILVRHLTKVLKTSLGWLFSSKEYTNYSYDLTMTNKGHLAAFVSTVAAIPMAQAMAYIVEAEQDQELRDHITKNVDNRLGRVRTDRTGWLNKRLGWYAIARAIKPGIIIETGVDKGLGSVVLSAALLRNASEGHPGTYYGTDINPQAGLLFTGKYATTGKILYGDSITSLKALTETVDLFINDSDHSADYELREYEVIESKLSSKAILLADNAHGSDSLLRHAGIVGKSFLFWKEQPRNHWYSGAGIGAAFRQK